MRRGRYNLPEPQSSTYHGNLQAFIDSISERIGRLERTTAAPPKAYYFATSCTGTGGTTSNTANATDGDFETTATASRSGNVSGTANNTFLSVGGFGDSTVDNGRRYVNQKLSIKAWATILNEGDATDTATVSLQLSLDGGTTWEVTLQTVSATGAAATNNFKYDNRFTPYRLPDGFEPKNLQVRLNHTAHGAAVDNDGSVSLNIYEVEWKGEY